MSVIKATLTKVNVINLLKGVDVSYEAVEMLTPELLTFVEQYGKSTWNEYNLNNYSLEQLFTVYQAVKGNDISILREYIS